LLENLRRRWSAILSGVGDTTQKSWALEQGDRLIGTLIFEGQDMFWSDCRFLPGPGWAGVRPLFERSRDAWRSGDTDTAIAADEAISAAGLVLQPSDGTAAITDFLLRIDGDEARFRW
jgi:hypothetical protein